MLNYIENSNKITGILEKIDEVFKILFGWFKLGDKEFVSYLRNEKGSHYKLFLEKPPEIEEYSGPLPISEMKIVSEDILLSNLSITIKGKKQLYSKVQLGIANIAAFDEKPRFHPEAESFQEFD